MRWLGALNALLFNLAHPATLGIPDQVILFPSLVPGLVPDIANRLKIANLQLYTVSSPVCSHHSLITAVSVLKVLLLHTNDVGCCSSEFTCVCSYFFPIGLCKVCRIYFHLFCFHQVDKAFFGLLAAGKMFFCLLRIALVQSIGRLVLSELIKINASTSKRKLLARCFLSSKFT